jgi:hypothetical protein
MPVVIVPPASASNAAFYTIFGIFVWAIRHDLAGRAAWRRRQEAARRAAGEPAGPPTPDRPSRPPHTQS